MDSVDSLDNVQGHSGKSPVSPWTKSSETSWTGQCPGSLWTKSRDSVDSVDSKEFELQVSMNKPQHFHLKLNIKIHSNRSSLK